MGTSMKIEALCAYRTLLKATRKTFGGNKEYLSESYAEVRKKFELNRDATGEDEVKKLISNAYKASHFLTDVLSQPNPDDDQENKPEVEPEPAKEKVEIPTAEILKRL